MNALMSATSRLEVLIVLGDFDRTGGGSMELVAWELLSTPTVIAPVWEEMLAQQLIAPSGVDALSGEQMFRLTAAGRAELRDADLRDQRRSPGT
jgi:hypothetical protein